MSQKTDDESMLAVPVLSELERVDMVNSVVDVELVRQWLRKVAGGPETEVLAVGRGLALHGMTNDQLRDRIGADGP